MNREALRDRLQSDRKPGNKPWKSTPTPVNGLDTVLPGLRNVEGKKLKEAASYLDSARKALLHWTRETGTKSDNYETDADHLREVLGFCAALARIKTTIEFKAHLYGETT